MVQMVRRRSVAVLLRPRQAVLAAPTDAAAEADADEFADADAGVGLCLSWAQRDDPPDAFVPADVRQLDCCDGLAVGAGSGAGFGVQVCCVSG